jgi:hypothetical protein
MDQYRTQMIYILLLKHDINLAFEPLLPITVAQLNTEPVEFQVGRETMQNSEV